MRHGLRVSLVLPCRNEAECLRLLLPSLPSCIDECVVVNNGSTDDTEVVGREFGAVVVTEPRRGMGYAHQRGLAEASGDLIVAMDGDNTYPVEIIPSLLDMMQQHDLDFLSCGRLPLLEPGAMSLRNEFGNRMLTQLVNWGFGLHLRDVLSGMWVVRRSCRGVMTPRESGVPVCVEIKLNAFLNSAISAAEVHIPYHPRREGRSKLAPWRDGWRCLCFVWYRYQASAAALPS